MGGGEKDEGQSAGFEPARTEWWKKNPAGVRIRGGRERKRKGAEAVGNASVRQGGRELLIGADGVLEAITFELCKKIVLEV